MRDVACLDKLMAQLSPRKKNPRARHPPFGSGIQQIIGFAQCNMDETRIFNILK